MAREGQLGTMGRSRHSGRYGRHQSSLWRHTAAGGFNARLNYAHRLDQVYQGGILFKMHVIAKPALVEFWKKHPDAEGPLEAWYRIMRRKVFADFNALRDTFGSADYVDPFTVFNIGGNKYRLIAVIHYNRRKVYIRQVLTHAEYDRDKWKRRN